MNATALIAEDEPLLAAHLQAELLRLWPGLRVLANVRHGEAAVQQALALRPDVLFLDIRMPGLGGLEAAQALAEDWPEAAETPADGAAPAAFPLIVFVTAYDQYAVQAFERAAVDYVLKPVSAERLAQTCARVQAALRPRGAASSASTSMSTKTSTDTSTNDNTATAATRPGNAAGTALTAAVEQLRGLLASVGAAPAPAAGATPLHVIQAGVGAAIHLVPVDEVLYFEAADKYVRVVTADRDHLIRLSLRELLPQLDMQRFWQIHRSTVVRCDAIATALRDDTGKLTLTLRKHADRLPVSRLYAHQFKAM